MHQMNKAENESQKENIYGFPKNRSAGSLPRNGNWSSTHVTTALPDVSSCVMLQWTLTDPELILAANDGLMINSLFTTLKRCWYSSVKGFL